MKIKKIQWFYKKIIIKPIELFKQGILFTFRQAQGIALRAKRLWPIRVVVSSLKYHQYICAPEALLLHHIRFVN